MPSDPDAFLRSCIANGFIVDANLFLLLAFGTAHKRTYGMEEELNIVKSITSYCSDKDGKLILTPHIIAEVSNMLINRRKGGFNFSGNANFAKMTDFIREAQEHPVEKELILDNSHLAYVGFTDLSIMEAAKAKDFGVLTSDNELFCKLLDAGCQAANPKVIAEAKVLHNLLPAR